MQRQELLATIDRAVGSSIELRSKKELIEKFIEQVNMATHVEDGWLAFVAKQREKDLQAIIEAENLKVDETRKFMDTSLRHGVLKTTGMDIDRILPPISRFSGGGRAAKKQSVIEKLMTYFEKYLGLG